MPTFASAIRTKHKMINAIMTKAIRITSVRNAHGVKVKRCCASCQHKYIEKDGTRVCALMMLKVGQRFRCKQWQMSDGLKNAGLLK